MALKTDYKDDIPKTENRRYQMINNSDGTVSFVDVTEYTQVGDTFGAGDINATNESVNGKVEITDIVDPALVTQEGFAADALKVKEAISEQNKNLEDVGEAVLLAEASVNSTKNFTNIDLTPYREVLVVGYKYSSNINVFVGADYLPTKLMTINSRIITKYFAGGTQNSFIVTRTADKAFTLQADGADNYDVRFYGIK